MLDNRIARKPDYLLLALVALLLAIGLQAVYSATFGLAPENFGDITHYVARQGMWAALGAVLLIAGTSMDYRRWQRLSPYILLLGIAALGVVLVPGLGIRAYGATRALRLPSPLTSLQPSEFVKLAMIIYLSAWLDSQDEKVKQFYSGVVPFVLILSVVGALIMLQPDLGTTLVICLTAVTLFFLGGAAWRHMVLLGIGGIGAVLLLISIAGYRKERLLSFLGFGQDPRGADFHIIQALIGIGSGGLFGQGIGASRQKFFYLPDIHTDSIFAVIAEELGFVGSLVVLFLLATVIWRGFKIAAEASDRFGSLLASGITCWITYQALINIGGITKTIPLTGITLPFISYGGSSLVSFMAGIGIMLSISRYGSQGERKPHVRVPEARRHA